MGIPNKIEAYRSKDYWDERYKNETEFAEYEWFKKYSDLKQYLKDYLFPNSRILILGCGNSRTKASYLGLGQDLYEDGYENVVNVDYSEVVIETMKMRYPQIQWLVMDIRNMTFDDNSFDLVIDKATIDALMSEKGDLWNPSEDVVSDVSCTLKEVCRILKHESGVFFYLTFGQPHFRKRFLEIYPWSLEIFNLGMYFIYVTKKLA